ncbi:MAG: ABC transporter permease [Candidatus Cloacimonas sp.]|jgi:putative ABC transport system permease protein|nr:ABC transporter permease [Candidatus Cloacimonas sp.]
MHFRDGIRSAFQSIFSHKLRSLLTLTGIVIGVLAVVTMFSSVYALKGLIKKNMDGMGWNYSLIITPGTNTDDSNHNRSGIKRAKQSVPSLNYDDFLALQTELKTKSMYGIIESNSLFRIGNKTRTVRLRAATEEFFHNKTYPIGQGRYYNAYENDNAMPVAVLGHQFAQEYYKQGNPIGQTLQLGTLRLTIVGILAEDALSMGNGMNFNTWERREDLKAVYVPLKYGAQYLGTGGVIHQIYLQAASEAEFATLKKESRQLLLARHNMFPNFSFMDVGALMLTITTEIDKFMKKWNITLIAIASISLIVGGIGLFSTLLISIQERMSEIGIRKSIGASENDIFFYFIFEAVALAFLGAALGVLLAWLLIVTLAKAIHFPLFLPIQGVVLGVAFSLFIGFLSGIYPALKAAGIDPIQAIYYRE